MRLLRGRCVAPPKRQFGVVRPTIQNARAILRVVGVCSCAIGRTIRDEAGSDVGARFAQDGVTNAANAVAENSNQFEERAELL